jgi:hypothetical protein
MGDIKPLEFVTEGFFWGLTVFLQLNYNLQENGIGEGLT